MPVNIFDQFDQNPTTAAPDANPFDQFGGLSVKNKPAGELPAGTAKELPSNVVPGSGTATGVTGDMPFDPSSGPTLQGTTDTLRALNAGLIPGWPTIAGGLKSLFGGGIMKNIAEEQAASKAATAQHPEIETLGAMISPVNRAFQTENAISNIANPFARWGARALGYGAEGSIYSGIKAAGEGSDIPGAMLKGGALSAGTSPLGGALTPYEYGSAPTTQDFKDMLNDATSKLSKIRYGDRDVGRTSYGAQTDLTAQQYNPALDANKVGRFTDAFTKWAQDPSQEHSALQLLNWRDKASERGADALASRIDTHLYNATPVKGANSANDALDAIESADKAAQNHAISAALDPQTYKIRGAELTASPTYSEARQLTGAGTAAGTAAEGLGAHAWRIAHSLAEPAAVMAGMHGGVVPLATSVAATLGIAPALQSGMNRAMASQVPGMINRWRAGAAGALPLAITADPNWQRTLQSMLLGRGQ